MRGVSRAAWRAISASSLVAALALLASSRLFVEPPPLQVNVRWQDTVDAPDRARLERRFTLTPAEQIATNAWRYDITDTSPATIGALVGDPAVADTHYINRETFQLEPDAPRGERRPGPWGRRSPSLAFALVDHGPALLIILALAAFLFARDPEILARGVPELSPRAFATFRAVFAVALALYVYAHPFPRESLPRDAWRSDVVVATFAPVRWLIEHPALVFAGQAAGGISALLLAAGVWPRVTYAVAAIGITQWLLAFAVYEDSHKFGVLIFPLLALLAARWDTHQPPKRAGFAPWMLTVALGAAWAAAAWSKLRDGPGWVINGAVRYHFVTDYPNAHVDWGLAIAAMPVLAIVLSGAAVLVEAGTIVVAFFDKAMFRLGVGLAGAGLLAGFYLFQGLVWPAWWMLLLGFLPWSWLNGSTPAAAAAAGRVLSPLQMGVAIALLAQQLIVSAAFVELPPMVSRYDMYSTSHESPEAFERDNPPGVKRRLLAVDGRGTTTDVSTCAAGLDQPQLADLSRVNADTPLPAALRACAPAQNAPEKYLVVESRCGFDWKAGRFSCSGQDTVVAAWPAGR
jgi:hypothetical protein